MTKTNIFECTCLTLPVLLCLALMLQGCTECPDRRSPEEIKAAETENLKQHFEDKIAPQGGMFVKDLTNNWTIMEFKGNLWLVHHAYTYNTAPPVVSVVLLPPGSIPPEKAEPTQ